VHTFKLNLPSSTGRLTVDDISVAKYQVIIRSSTQITRTKTVTRTNFEYDVGK
jgi:hypothetical protein